MARDTKRGRQHDVSFFSENLYLNIYFKEIQTAEVGYRDFGKNEV